MLGDDRNWLIAGLAGAFLIPFLVLVLGLPALVAVPIGLVAFFGLALILAPRKLFEGIDVSKVARSQVELAKKVLNDAEPALQRLDQASDEIKTPKIKQIVQHLSSTAQSIIKGVEQDPGRLASVQRFLTYYLPSAAEVSDSYVVLEKQRSPDPKRLKQSEQVIVMLDNAFSHYADSLLESDLSNLDVELRLIESAVKEDLKGPA